MSTVINLLCLCFILTTQLNVGVAVQELSEVELSEAVGKFSFLLVFFSLLPLRGSRYTALLVRTVPLLVHYQDAHTLVQENGKICVPLTNESPCESEACRNMSERIMHIADAVSALEIPVVQISNSAFAGKLGLDSAPHLVFYRDSIPLVVDVGLDNIDEVIFWIEQNKQSYVQELDDSSFEHQTQAATGATTGDWLVQFYTPDCDELKPVWHAVASRLHSRLNVASVNLATCPQLQKRFEVNGCPAVTFFRHGKMYIYELPLKNVESYVSFAEGWYKNAPVKAVPKVATPFDNIIQICVEFIREYSDSNSFVGAMCVFLVLITLFLIRRCCCRRRKSKLF